MSRTYRKLKHHNVELYIGWDFYINPELTENAEAKERILKRDKAIFHSDKGKGIYKCKHGKSIMKRRFRSFIKNELHKAIVNEDYPVMRYDAYHFKGSIGWLFYNN